MTSEQNTRYYRRQTNRKSERLSRNRGGRETMAIREGKDHNVRWSCVSGRAVDTNTGAHPELIQPFGVRIQGGRSPAVFWMPGETAYSTEVY